MLRQAMRSSCPRAGEGHLLPGPSGPSSALLPPGKKASTSPAPAPTGRETSLPYAAGHLCGERLPVRATCTLSSSSCPGRQGRKNRLAYASSHLLGEGEPYLSNLFPPLRHLSRRSEEERPPPIRRRSLVWGEGGGSLSEQPVPSSPVSLSRRTGEKRPPRLCRRSPA